MNYLSGDISSAVEGESGSESIYLGIKVLEAQEEETEKVIERHS